MSNLFLHCQMFFKLLLLIIYSSKNSTKKFPDFHSFHSCPQQSTAPSYLDGLETGSRSGAFQPLGRREKANYHGNPGKQVGSQNIVRVATKRLRRQPHRTRSRRRIRMKVFDSLDPPAPTPIRNFASYSSICYSRPEIDEIKTINTIQHNFLYRTAARRRFRTIDKHFLSL